MKNTGSGLERAAHQKRRKNLESHKKLPSLSSQILASCLQLYNFVQAGFSFIPNRRDVLFSLLHLSLANPLEYN